MVPISMTVLGRTRKLTHGRVVEVAPQLVNEEHLRVVGQEPNENEVDMPNVAEMLNAVPMSDLDRHSVKMLPRRKISLLYPIR